jgi:hypothetical protein
MNRRSSLSEGCLTIFAAMTPKRSTSQHGEAGHYYPASTIPAFFTVTIHTADSSTIGSSHSDSCALFILATSCAAASSVSSRSGFFSSKQSILLWMQIVGNRKNLLTVSPFVRLWCRHRRNETRDRQETPRTGRPRGQGKRPHRFHTGHCGFNNHRCVNCARGAHRKAIAQCVYRRSRRREPRPHDLG